MEFDGDKGLEDWQPVPVISRNEMAEELLSRPVPADVRNMQNRVEPGKLMSRTDRLFEKLSNKSLKRKEVSQVQQILRADRDQWRLVGDLAREARIAAVEGSGGHATVQGLSVQEGVEQMRQKLTNPNSNDLEKLMIDQILTCWVQCGATAMKLESIDYQLCMNVEGRFWESRHHNAHARLVRSVEALARLRGLGLQIVSASENTVINVIGTQNKVSPPHNQNDSIVSRQ